MKTLFVFLALNFLGSNFALADSFCTGKEARYDAYCTVQPNKLACESQVFCDWAEPRP